MVAYTMPPLPLGAGEGGQRAHRGGNLEGGGEILCNSVKTSVIREKIYIKIDILELSRTFHNILEDSRPF